MNRPYPGLARRITPLWLLGFLSILIALAVLLYWSDATRKLDRLLHDTWVRTTQRAVPDDVVILAIDPVSLAEYGRWPWPRDTQALLYRRLASAGVHLVAIDMIYIEAAVDADADRRLAEALSRFPRLVLPILTEAGNSLAVGEKLPLPIFTREAEGLGHIFMPIDDDGIVRRVPLRAGYFEAHWPALSLAAYDVLGGDVDARLDRYDDAPDNNPGSGWLTANEVMIPFYGPSGSIRRVSAAALLQGTVAPGALADKIVFVGMTATGLSDMVPTPVSALDSPMPGVELHATVFSALRDGSLVARANLWLGLVPGIVLLPLLVFVYSRTRPEYGVIVALIGASLPILGSWVLYRFFQLWYPPLAISLTVLASYLVWSWHRLAFINRFLENETRKLAPLLPRRDSSDDDELSEFFEHARRHLPLAGWLFVSRGQRFEGGERIGRATVGSGEHWSERHGIWSKRYPTPGGLEIHLKLRRREDARAIMHYVDSLARVKSRRQPGRLAGSIEQLQDTAMRLGDQLAWLSDVKVFSETLLEGSPGGFVVWNPAGEMVRCNAQVHGLLPHLADKPLLADFLDEIAGGIRVPFERDSLIHELLFDGTRRLFRCTRGEQELVVNFSTVGTRLANRIVCAYLVDVTALRTAERARAEMVDYLSHDLRSPLVSALYCLEEDDEAGLPLNAREQVAINIRRSMQMMDDLLQVARADSLDSDKLSEVLFDDVVGNAIDVLAPQARNSGVELLTRFGEEDLWVYGDASLLERAVVNIIGNAIKYSVDGGIVEITTGSKQGFVVLRVADQGVGIDPAMHSRLFKRFNRDARIAGQIKGTGLGLALVAHVAARHGGSVHAETPQKGTVIVFRVPLAPLDDAQIAD